MGARTFLIKSIVAAVLAAGLDSIPAFAQDPAEIGRVDELFKELQEPGRSDYDKLEQQIVAEWSRSGSPSMDLLLQRGQSALAAQDYPAAVDFFTALTDHAPDFAEGWNARATAYFNEGHYGLAVADIRRTLELNPRHFVAMSGLALILQDLGRDKDALEAWRQVQALTPNQASVKETIEKLEVKIGGQSL